MHKNFLSLICCLVLFLLSIKSSFSQCSEIDILNLRKTALIFGEKDYKHAGALTNPINDALDISDSLKKIGFDVTTYSNTDFNSMNTAIQNWLIKIPKYDVALFYYSGHGAEVNGVNYLFPIDANPKGPSDLYYSAYNANKLLVEMENSNSKFNIIILDACRNNPFTKGWARDITTNGLASMTGKGSFIGFAASPGTTASDGTGRNGTYTEGILKYITTANLTIDQIFTRVNSYVRSKSNEVQIPFKNSSLSVDFYFSVKNGKKTPPAGKLKFLQPNSEIVLTSNDELFFADSLNGLLSIKDAKSLNNVSNSLNERIRPLRLTIANGDNIYIIDSVARNLFVIDRHKKTITTKISLKFRPNSIAVTSDQRKAYISYQDSMHKGSISVIDLVSYKTIKSIQTNYCLTEAVISPDGKTLYAISQCNNERGAIMAVDTKSDKVFKVVEGTFSGIAIGITPDGKKILTSYKSNGISQINILDANTFKSLKTLNFKSNHFSFSLDGKYAFSLGEKEIAVIRIEDEIITNRLPFATTPSGLALSNDLGYIALPFENRVFVFEINKHVENKLGFDPETSLKDFIAEVNKSTNTIELSRTKEVLGHANSEFISAVNKLKQELGNNFSTSPNRRNITINSTLGYDYKDHSYKGKHGIYLIYDNNKNIVPFYKVKISNNSLILIIKESESAQKEELFKMPIDNADWEGLKKFVRTYFIVRIKQLK